MRLRRRQRGQKRGLGLGPALERGQCLPLQPGQIRDGTGVARLHIRRRVDQPVDNLQSQIGTKAQYVPYRGTGPAMQDLVAGQIDIIVDQASNSLPQVQGGKIKAYASAGKVRLPQLPEVPAITDAGVEGFDINISFGLYAPKGTPKPVLDQLNSALQKSVADPEVRQRLEVMGISAVSLDQARPEALRQHLKNEIDTLGSLLVKAGVKAN